MKGQLSTEISSLIFLKKKLNGFKIYQKMQIKNNLHEKIDRKQILNDLFKNKMQNYNSKNKKKFKILK